MNKKERVNVREQIIKAARNGKFNLPPISRSFIEIIDPYEIDETLLELIENGQEPFTDDLFFECLSESPDYLAYEPFRVRIKEWRNVLRNSRATEFERGKAKANLKKIGQTLARETRGRPEEHEDLTFILPFEYVTSVEELKPFLEGTKELSRHQWISVFKEKFPHLASYANLLRSHTSAKEIAKAILVKKYKISKRSLLKKLPKSNLI